MSQNSNKNSLSNNLSRRKPLLSARMIAVAVIFGAINGAFTALHIAIPGYLPGVSFNFSGIWLTLATMIGGPIVGAIVALVGSLTSSSPGIFGWPGYLIHILIFSACYPLVFRIKNIPLRAVAFVASVIIALAAQYLYYIVLFGYIIKYIPVAALVALDFGYAFWIFLLIYCVVPIIILSVMPHLVAPQWRWPWQKFTATEEDDETPVFNKKDNITDELPIFNKTDGITDEGDLLTKSE